MSDLADIGMRIVANRLDTDNSQDSITRVISAVIHEGGGAEAIPLAIKLMDWYLKNEDEPEQVGDMIIQLFFQNLQSASKEQYDNFVVTVLSSRESHVVPIQKRLISSMESFLLQSKFHPDGMRILNTILTAKQTPPNHADVRQAMALALVTSLKI